MTAAQPDQHRLLRVGRRFCRAREGGYAVEFAIVGSLFVILTLVICQYAMIFLARDSIALALQQATRTLLTGSFQQGNAGSTNQAQILQNLRATICGVNLESRSWFFRCSDLKLDVRVAGSFSASGSGGAVVDSATQDWAAGFGSTYACPGPKSIAVVRAAVKYPLFVRSLGFGLSVFADGSALVQSAAVFRVEPYQSGSGGAC
ncbi:MAG: pilus assembly protein [Parafilimonas terrae]|nr:pilus assembly protein [Parafilimonas terrae]